MLLFNERTKADLKQISTLKIIKNFLTDEPDTN